MKRCLCGGAHHCVRHSDSFKLLADALSSLQIGHSKGSKQCPLYLGEENSDISEGEEEAPVDKDDQSTEEELFSEPEEDSPGEEKFEKRGMKRKTVSVGMSPIKLTLSIGGQSKGMTLSSPPSGVLSPAPSMELRSGGGKRSKVGAQYATLDAIC